MLYHASQTANITELTPHISNHGRSLIYFSEKPQNVLVYLSNAVEKYCKENGFHAQNSYTKWASYGFNKEGILVLEEYYPNATKETYAGVSGYIYTVDQLTQGEKFADIPFVWTASKPVRVTGSTYIPDAYLAILEAEEKGGIVCRSYEDMSEKGHRWLEKVTVEEYRDPNTMPDYKFFLKGKFGDILRKNKLI